MTYALVTPARDEAASLLVLAPTITGQTRPPACWVIVDDGSSDATAEVAAELALQHPWIVLVRSGRVEDGLRQGRREGRDLLSFEEGRRAIPRPVELVTKLDADVTLPPNYFERLVAAFAADPQLGMASGTRCEQIQGRWRPRPLTRSTIAGQCRTYRLACWESIQPLEPHMGWDGIDEARAVLAGWRVHPVPGLYFRHHRPRGRRDGSAWRARAAEGAPRTTWAIAPPICSYVLSGMPGASRCARDALGLVGRRRRREPPCSDVAARRPCPRPAGARHFGRRYREARGATTG